jgi:hypothetical protein
MRGETLSLSWIAQVMYCSCRYGCGVKFKEIHCLGHGLHRKFIAPAGMVMESDSRRDIVWVMDCRCNVLLLNVWRWSQTQGKNLSGSWIAEVMYCC